MDSEGEGLHDAARLRALGEANLLDTPPEEAFDRLTRLAARLLDAPLALVNLVDDQRQFSKSCFAPSDWPAGREASLSDSFCQHVVIAREPLRIEDAEADRQVSSSAMVTELGVRSYLGVPLSTPEGHVLGTLCVSDFVPRAWSDEQVETLRDLAASVMTEIELRRDLGESEQRASLIVESIRDYGIMELGPDGRIRAWNAGAEQTTGYAREEALGQHFSFLYPPEDIQRGEPERELAEAMENGRAERQGWGVRKDGSRHWTHKVVTPIRARGGQRVGFVQVVQDQTEQRRSEEREKELAREQAARAEAEEAERRISDMLESITDAFVTLDRGGRVTYVNSRAEELFGARREALVGQVPWETYPQIKDTPVHVACARAVAERVALDLDHASRLRPGTWLHFHVAPTSDGVALYIRDVTAGKRAQELLEQMGAAMEASIDGIGIVSDQGVFTYVNRAQAELYGYDRPQDLIGQDWSVLVEEEERQRLAAEAMAIYAREGRWRGEGIGLRRDGSTFPLDIAMTRIDHVGFVCVGRDITTRKAAERVIHQAQAEAEAANRAKSDFLSRMSHELRTPLNAILGFGQLLEMDVEEGENREGVEQIVKAGRLLLALIDEVLDIARIEAGRMSLSVEPVAVQDALHESADLVRQMAAQHGVALRTRDALASSQFVRADQQRLKQVLLNLLSNAIKYNRRGGAVTLSCEAVGEDRLRIAVRDTGHGIPAEKLERLFRPFERLGAEQSGVQGTGLGLALSKGLVEAMGGRLGVESVEEEGSTFWVELPLAPRPEEAATAPEPGRMEAAGVAAEPTHTVLFVEDNLANVRLVERLFQRRPHVRLLTTMQGSLGLDLAREHQPDLILLDLGLPDLSGEAVLARLRGDERTRDIPVVILSADAMPGHIRKIMESGARDYLTKPLDVQRFLELVDGMLLTRGEA